jgi:hypothetical protein
VRNNHDRVTSTRTREPPAVVISLGFSSFGGNCTLAPIPFPMPDIRWSLLLRLQLEKEPRMNESNKTNFL